MKAYHDLLQRILDEGTIKSDRTGVGTKSVFGHQMRFDLSEGFPAMTTKKLFLKGINDLLTHVQLVVALRELMIVALLELLVILTKSIKLIFFFDNLVPHFRIEFLLV